MKTLGSVWRRRKRLKLKTLKTLLLAERQLQHRANSSMLMTQVVKMMISKIYMVLIKLLYRHIIEIEAHKQHPRKAKIAF